MLDQTDPPALVAISATAETASNLANLIDSASNAGLVPGDGFPDIAAAAAMDAPSPADVWPRFAAALRNGPAAEKALAAIERLFDPADVVELRALAPDGGAVSLSGRLGDDGEREALRAFLAGHNGSRNLYFGANPRQQSMAGATAAGKSENVTCRRSVFLDLDDKDAPDPDPDWRLTLEDLETLGPALVINTGNGLHVWFDVAEVPSSDLPASVEPLKRALSVIGSDDVADEPRIARLPFTVNLPTKSKRARGAVPKMALPRHGTGTTARPEFPRALDELCSAFADTAERLRLPGRAEGTVGSSERHKAKGGAKSPSPAPSAELLRLAVSLLPNDSGHFDDRAAWVAVCHAIRGAANAAGCEEDGRDAWLGFCNRFNGRVTPGAAENLWSGVKNPRSGWAALTKILERVNSAGAAQIATIEFEPVSLGGRKPLESFDLQPVTVRSASSIPPRPWLYGTCVVGGNISVIVAPGGVGKSALLMTEVLAMVTGRELLPGEKPIRPLRVWYHNAEDSDDEQQRRLGAAMKHHSITGPDLGDRLFLTSGREIGITLARGDKGAAIVVPGIEDALCDKINGLGIDVLALDPYGAMHSTPESVNEAQNVVMGVLRSVAHRTGVAPILVHHTSKVAAQNMGSAGAGAARGASAITDAARVVRQLGGLDTKQAKRFGVPESDRDSLVRVLNGKANLTQKQGDHWIRKVGVQLGNGNDSYPSGDNVQTVERWEPPGPVELQIDDQTKVYEAVVQCTTQMRRDSQSPDWVGYCVAEALCIDVGEHAAPASCRTPLQKRARKEISEHVSKCLESGVLEVYNGMDDRRRPKEFIRAGMQPNVAPSIQKLSSTDDAQF